MKSVDLFVGAGGLAIGVSRAGFRHKAVVEFDQDACATIRENQRRGVEPMAHWPLVESDVREVDFAPLSQRVDLLSGGPPCQPFSLGGKHRGHRDHRNLFPEVFRVARELRPRAILIENVKGLLRESFAPYFEYICLQLSCPELVPKDGETWQQHLGRLQAHRSSGSESGLSYQVSHDLVNAADYGVPQRRERVIIVAVRQDLGVTWQFPSKTHSLDALLWHQWVSGDYWERHGMPPGNGTEAPSRVLSRIRRLKGSMEPPELPWRTVRDALADLPTPNGDDSRALNHRVVLGARAYPGHCGSPLDEPAKTLKAGDHGVPGGENMLLERSGEVRYFTLREAARLQTFPDDYYFPGSWTESMRQLGNAVPVLLAQRVAEGVYSMLESAQRSSPIGTGVVQPARQAEPRGQCREGAAAW